MHWNGVAKMSYSWRVCIADAFLEHIVQSLIRRAGRYPCMVKSSRLSGLVPHKRSPQTTILDNNCM